MSEQVFDDEGTIKWRNSEGQFHRTGGPAVVKADGTKEWWLNDRKLTEAEFKMRMFAKGVDR